MYDIFVSYRRSDRAFVDQLVQRLQARGVSVWYDSQIEGGDDWREKIVAALTDSDMLVILFSEDANNSRQLKKELAVADQLEKPVVPVLIEDCKPRGAYLYELADRNWLQVFPNPMAQIDKLVERLVDLAGKSPGGIGGSGAQEQAPPPAAAPREAPPWSDTSGAEPAPAPAPQPPPAMAPPPDLAEYGATPPQATPKPSKPDASRSAPPPLRAYGTGTQSSASAYVGKKSQRGKKPLPTNDILPFRWIDIVFLTPLIVGVGALLEATGMDPGSDSMAARVTAHLLFAVATTGFYGALVFPVRYYMRRRPPLVALGKYAISSVLLYAGLMGAYLGGDMLGMFPNDEPVEIAIWFGAFFFVFAMIAFLIYGVLSAQRAIRSFRSNIKKL
ncbi:TIR domain-containing protein [bacterium]|nr:TIR domain-containing protein [bacterium]